MISFSGAESITSGFIVEMNGLVYTLKYVIGKICPACGYWHEKPEDRCLMINRWMKRMIFAVKIEGQDNDE